MKLPKYHSIPLNPDAQVKGSYFNTNGFYINTVIFSNTVILFMEGIPFAIFQYRPALLPIILFGNSFLFTYYSQNYSKYSWSNSWNFKSQMDILLQLKIYPLTSIKIIRKDRDTLIEQSQLNLSDCSIRVSDCSIR